MDERIPVPQTALPPWEEDPRRAHAGWNALSILLILAVIVCGFLAKSGTCSFRRELYERFAWGDTHEDLEAMGMQALSDDGTGISLMGVPSRPYMVPYDPDGSADFLGLNSAVYYYAIDPSDGVKALMIYKMGLDEKDCQKIVRRLSLHYGLIPDKQGDSPASPYGYAARRSAAGLREKMGKIRGKTWYRGDRAIALTTFRESSSGSGADQYALELIITPYPDGQQATAEGAAEPTAAPPSLPHTASADPDAREALGEALTVLTPSYNKKADFTIWLAGEYAEAELTPESNYSGTIYRTKDLGKRIFIDAATASADYSGESDAAIDRNVIQPILKWEKQLEHTDLGHGVYRTENITWARLEYEMRGGTGVLHYRGCDGKRSVDLRFFKDTGLFTEEEALLCDWIAASYTPGSPETPPLQ